MGQTNVHRYLPRLMNYIREGKINPAEIITDAAPLSEAAAAYKKFHEKRDGCIKVVLKP